MTKFEVGNELYINLGSATAPGRLAVSGVYGTIGYITEKAVRLDSYSENNKLVQLWFPRKALVKVKNTTEIGLNSYRADLATWFNPTAEFMRKINMVRYNSIVSA